MHLPRPLSSCLVTLILLSALGCKPDSSSSSAAMLPEYTVSVGHPRLAPVSLMREWVGQLVSMAEAPIIPQVQGYIQERLFTNGQRVKKGEVLYRIQDDLYLQAYQQAQQKVSSLEAQYKKAQQDADYYKPLVEGGSISRQTYTDAEQSAKAAAASLEAAKAAAAHAKTNLGYCTLTSPMDGLVGFTTAFVGSYVSPSSPSLVLVNQLNPIRVYFSISEQDWLKQGGVEGDLKIGTPVELILSNGQVYPHKAIIAGVDNKVKTSTGTLMLDARVDNPDELLRPGMYVLVKACVEKIEQALLVPQLAITQVQGKSMILLYHAEDKSVSMLPVTLGATQGDDVVIVNPPDALNTSSLIITKGTQQGMMAAMKRARLKVDQTKTPS